MTSRHLITYRACFALHIHVRSLSAISLELGKAISSGFPSLRPSSSRSTLNRPPCVLIKTLMLPPAGTRMPRSHPPHSLRSHQNCYGNSQLCTGANCLHLVYICSHSLLIIKANHELRLKHLLMSGKFAWALFENYTCLK